MERPSVPSSGSRPLRAARSTAGTHAPTRPSGTLLRTSRSSGSAKSLQEGGRAGGREGGLGTGVGKLVSVLGNFHFWLVGLGVRGLATLHPNTGATHVVDKAAVCARRRQQHARCPGRYGPDWQLITAVACARPVLRYYFGMGPYCDSVALASLALPRWTSLMNNSVVFGLPRGTLIVM